MNASTNISVVNVFVILGMMGAALVVLLLFYQLIEGIDRLCRYIEDKRSLTVDPTLDRKLLGSMEFPF